MDSDASSPAGSSGAGDAPLYTSKPSAKNLWQDYRIHRDRIELDLHVVGRVTVPFEAIEDVRERPPIVILDLFRGEYGFRELMRSPKLDWADLHEHVVIEKDGFWKQFRITPSDPGAFVDAFRQAFRAWKEARGQA